MHMREKFHEIALEHPDRLVLFGNEQLVYDTLNLNNFGLTIKRIGIRRTHRDGCPARRWTPGSLDPRKQSEALVENKLEKETRPRVVKLEVIVKLRRHCLEFRQIIPGNRRCSMILVILTHIQTYPVDRAVVAVSLLVRIVRIMLLDPARANRVQ